MDFKEHLQINPDSTAQDIYQRERLAHWNEIARQMDHWSGLGAHCYKRLVEVYKSLIALDQRILEISCGRDDLQASMAPKFGSGVDFYNEIIKRCSIRPRNCHHHTPDRLSTPTAVYEGYLWRSQQPV